LDISSTVVTATIVSYTSGTGILKVSSPTGQFAENTSITSSGGATATVEKNDLGTATMTIGSVVDTAGTFINQDGWVSETAMRIQDSLYYQDFSYVIKVGRTINDWRDSFKKTMHTSGFYFTGQVDIQTQISAQIKNTVGINSGVNYEQVALIVNTLFSTIFGRRLGTTSDGTTLRVNPELGVDPDFNDSTSEHFTPNTRDLTLNKSMTLKIPSIAKIIIRGDEYKYGYAYCGPRMKTLDIYDNPFGTDNMFSGNHPNVQIGTIGADSTEASYISTMKMINWADHRIIGTNSTINGTGVQIRDYNNSNLKTYITYPTEISISY
jgi:hypothetical protein